jgi:hypothetical protein
VTRRRLALVLGLVLLAFVALIWAKPALLGPDVDCGPLDQTTCERAVRDVLEGAESDDNPYRPPVPMPVSYVAFTEASSCGSPGYVMYWVFPVWGVVASPGLC